MCGDIMAEWQCNYNEFIDICFYNKCNCRILIISTHTHVLRMEYTYECTRKAEYVVCVAYYTATCNETQGYKHCYYFWHDPAEFRVLSPQIDLQFQAVRRYIESDSINILCFEFVQYQFPLIAGNDWPISQGFRFFFSICFFFLHIIVY